MDQEYEVLYKISRESTFDDNSNSIKIKNLEKRMNAIKKRKIIHNCDQSWMNKARFSPKIYDNWYSPLNDKTLKIDSTYMHLSKCDYQGLVDLLFTSGELDADKVICLHVLASHPCDKLTIPPNCQARFETQTALDKLVERSKSFCGYRSGIKYNLPIYILSFNEARRQYISHKLGHKYITDTKFQDGRLATRLVINENLWRLVQTVIEALHHCNPPKMIYLLRVAHNVNYVRHIINNPQLQSFIKAVANQNIVLSSDSFLLTRPFESCIDLKIENPTHTLESIIAKIRKHVLYSESYDRITLEENAAEELAAAEKKSIYKLRGLKREIDVCLDFCHFDAEKISSLLSAKIRKAQEMDMKTLRRPATSAAPEYTPSNRKHKCYACTEKWRINMISGKTAEKTAKTIDNYKPKYSHSTQWLKLIIQEEENNLTKLKTKYVIPSLNYQPADEVAHKRPMVLNINEKKRFMKMKKTFSSEYMNPNKGYAENNLNLAKIKNEISTKENNKRVKKFLEEPIYTKKSVLRNSEFSIIPI